MKKGLSRATAFCMAAGIVLTQSSGLTMAAGTDFILVGIGSTEMTDEAVQEDDAAAEAAEEADAAPAEAAEEVDAAPAEAAEEADDAPAEAAVETDAAPAEAVEEDAAAAQEEEAWTDRSMVGTTGFASCEEYVNVRTSGDTEGEVVGKIYNNGSMEILDVDENGWYHVRSGNVEGYVSSSYVATGAEAEEIASSTGYTTAEVGAEVLNVRSDASTDSEIVDVIENALSVEVVEDNGDWVKVVTDNGVYGYVSADYVYTSTTYATGETLEEEQARLDEEWLAYLADQAAEEAAAAAAYAEAVSYDATYDYSADTSYDATYDYSANAGYDASYDYGYDASYDYGYDASYDYGYDAAAQQVYTQEQAYADTTYAQAQEAEAYAAQTYDYAQTTAAAYTDAQSMADAQYQAYLDAQAVADASVTSGDEQLVYATADAAVAAYNAYLEAQAYANEAAATQAQAEAEAQAAADAQAQADAAAAAAQTAADEAYVTYTDDTYTDDVYTDDVYTDDTYTEEGVAEEQVQSAPVSSVGAQVASYATQFVGNPYVWGGESLSTGADCSGFVMAVYNNFGVSLPHNAAAQSGYGTPVSEGELQPGDLVFYGDGISHVAMYIGNGQVVHASSSETGTIISNYNYRTPVCFRRMV